MSEATTRPVIVHIDDDEANRYAITRTLKKAGFDVFEGGTGKEALELAQKQPDLMILDVRLPDANGFEICRQIKADPATANIPVLHLSASFTTVDDRAQGLDAGADAYLIRPVEPVELVATVKALLRTRSAEDALRRSEERYRTAAERLGLALDSAELGTFYCPIPLNTIVWNETCKRHFWLPPDAEVDFDRFYSILHPDDRQRTEAAIADAIANRKPYDVEYRTVAPDGRTRWIRAKGKAYYDEAGNPLRFDGITIDISRQKEIEADRERALEAERFARTESERANQLKDEFLATLSHELRTPLNAIVGWSQILRGGTSTPEELAEGLDTIERNASVQAQLIEDLLDVSRIISGKLRLDIKPLDLAPVIDAAVAAVQHAADAKGIRLIEAVDATQTHVRGDSARLQQIVWNLLSNAIKFTPRGGRVELEARRSESQLQIIVRDTGRGIDPEFLPYVFDRFRQADPTTTRQHGGLGLGLAIVKHMAELHGGTVAAASEGENKGATFIVSLPVAPLITHSADESTPPVPPEKATSPCEPGELSNISVLIVEDDRDSRALLGRVLRNCGAKVGLAGSVDQALELLDEQPFSILISDIGMPVRDGYDLISEVRRRSREAGGKIPAMALTAFARAEDRAAALKAGFDVHLTKPAEPAQIVNTIQELCRQSS